MIKKTFLYAVLLICIKVHSQNKSGTVYCKLLYNETDSKSYSLRFDCGDQLSFTPDFFMLKDGKLTDSGFLYSDSLNNNLLNDSNHIALYSKGFFRYLKKHNHPAKNKYNGFHFYLFDAIILVDKENEFRSARWPAPLNKSTSEYKTASIRNIGKILKLTPIKSNKLQKQIWKNTR